MPHPPASTSSPPPATSAPEPELFGERQRNMVRDLVELNAYRGTLEREVKQAYETDARANQEDYDRRHQDIEGRMNQGLAAAERTRAGEGGRIAEVAEAKIRSANQEYEAEKERITDTARTHLQTTEKQRQEAIWATETVFDAKKDHPKKDLLVVTSELESKLESIVWFEQQTAGSSPLPTTVGDAEAELPPKLSDENVKGVLWELEQGLTRCGEVVEEIQGLLSAKLVSGWTPVALTLGLLLAGAGAAAALPWGRLDGRVMIGAVLGIAVAAAIMIAADLRARARSAALRQALSGHVRDARRKHDESGRLATALRDQQHQELVATRDREMSQAEESYGPIIATITERQETKLTELRTMLADRREVLEQRKNSQIAELDTNYQDRLAKIRERHDEDFKELTTRFESRRDEIEARYTQAWSELETRWREEATALFACAESIAEENNRLFPLWSDPVWSDWSPPHIKPPAVRFGEIVIDRAKLEGGMPEDERLKVPAPQILKPPASLVFPDACSMLVKFGDEGRDATVSLLQLTMLRLLTSLPPGKVKFTILDPIGLGQSFAGFMHLADHDESLVGGRIWTESRHFEQRLADLTEHIENVIQKYLRNDFETIAQYNEKAGEIAEPYRFLVISDLPTAFSEVAARRLASIVSSGARCGLFTLIGLDTRQPMPTGLELSDLHQHCHRLEFREGALHWDDETYGGFPLVVDEPPDDEFITRVLQRVGQGAKDSSRVEVPFESIMPPDGKAWTVSTIKELSVPLGRSGATKLQHLTLGHGTSQHALIAGKTGSGKSTLLHILITNLAIWCPPDEVEFYLVDFKKGVEFKTYATHELPHARVIAIESDREFGLSVLHRIDGELKRRGVLYRDAEVQDLASYRKVCPDEVMPRVLLVIDEFQEFFIEDDKVAQDAALLLDRLVRQGRAFGIHVLLGSQTLGGAYGLARSTLGQMAVRIALQCSEADSYLILSEDNAAARLLARPGEAIYNDASGLLEGNSPFQIAWLDDEKRDLILNDVRRRAVEKGCHTPDRTIIFEGNVPADVDRNHLLNGLLEREDWPDEPAAPAAWLGDAIAIKDPTSVVFRRQSGANMVVVGQRDESALAMLSMSVIGLAAQFAPDRAKFVVLDGTPSDTPLANGLARLKDHLPHEVSLVGYREVADVLAEISALCAKRQEDDDTSAPAVYLVVNALQRYRMLRQSEDFSFSMDPDDGPPSPDKSFATILREGPHSGVHMLIWADTLTNLERVVDRSSMREFDNRVLFQMSAADATNLTDSPAASRLGVQRAMLHNEQQGQLEKFRPYALPDEGWLDLVRQRLQR